MVKIENIENKKGCQRRMWVELETWWSEKELRAKRDDDACDFCEKVENNAMINEHENISKKQHLSANYVGILRFFREGKLIIIEDNVDCESAETMQEEGKVLKEEIIRTTKENEVIAENDNSCKEECVAGSWTIEDDFAMVSDDSSAWSSK